MALRLAGPQRSSSALESLGWVGGSTAVPSHNRGPLKKRAVFSNLHDRARRTLDQLDAVSLKSLSLPGLRLEKLKGDRSGQHSIRINEQYRVCFEWSEAGAEAVEIVDYH